MVLLLKDQGSKTTDNIVHRTARRPLSFDRGAEAEAEAAAGGVTSYIHEQPRLRS